MVRALSIRLWDVVDKDIQRYGWSGLEQYLIESRAGNKHVRKSVREIADALTTFGFGHYSVSFGTVQNWCKSLK